MTIERALKIEQNWTAEQARNDLERLLLTGERPANKVIALACKALEKQIPKKVTHEASLYRCCTCPTCKNVIDKLKNGARVRYKLNINIVIFVGKL